MSVKEIFRCLGTTWVQTSTHAVAPIAKAQDHRRSLWWNCRLARLVANRRSRNLRRSLHSHRGIPGDLGLSYFVGRDAEGEIDGVSD